MCICLCSLNKNNNYKSAIFSLLQSTLWIYKALPYWPKWACMPCTSLLFRPAWMHLYLPKGCVFLLKNQGDLQEALIIGVEFTQAPFHLSEVSKLLTFCMSHSWKPCSYRCVMKSECLSFLYKKAWLRLQSLPGTHSRTADYFSLNGRGRRWSSLFMWKTWIFFTFKHSWSEGWWKLLPSHGLHKNCMLQSTWLWVSYANAENVRSIKLM